MRHTSSPRFLALPPTIAALLLASVGLWCVESQAIARRTSPVLGLPSKAPQPPRPFRTSPSPSDAAERFAEVDAHPTGEAPFSQVDEAVARRNEPARLDPEPAAKASHDRVYAVGVSQEWTPESLEVLRDALLAPQDGLTRELGLWACARCDDIQVDRWLTQLIESDASARHRALAVLTLGVRSSPWVDETLRRQTSATDTLVREAARHAIDRRALSR